MKSHSIIVWTFASSEFSNWNTLSWHIIIFIPLCFSFDFCWNRLWPSLVAHQYISRCSMIHVVRTISETIHQRESEPLHTQATCLLRLHPLFSRRSLIEPINQWACLEKTRLQFRNERLILEDIFLGNKKALPHTDHTLISTYEQNTSGHLYIQDTKV